MLKVWKILSFSFAVDAESVQRELEMLTGLNQATPPRTPPLDLLPRDQKEAGGCRHVSSQSAMGLAPRSLTTSIGSRQVRTVMTFPHPPSGRINGTPGMELVMLSFHS